jgi:hypothetical protein
MVPTRTRRAAVYLVVLITSAIVAVTGVTALTVARLERRTADNADSFSAARFLAQSGLDFGIFLTSQNTDWRARFADGSLLAKRSLADADFELYASDPVDSDLEDWAYDPVVLTAVGCSGAARYALQTTLEPRRTPLPILGCALHAAGGINVSSGDTLTATGGTVSSNGTITYNSATINGSIECLVAVGVLGAVTGTTTILAGAKAMPHAGVVSMYSDAATPLALGTNDIKKLVLGPGYNPVGAPNADGLYVISSGANLKLSDSRVEGTLVVLCPGRTLSIESNVLLHNYRADFPALIVDGNVELKFTGGTNLLSESAQATNFNPAGAPYQGIVDGDLSDTYPSEIQGLMHVNGTIKVSATGRPWIRGSVICSSTALLDAVNIDGDTTLVHDDAVYDNPPLGYEATLEMRPNAGTWAQVPAP